MFLSNVKHLSFLVRRIPASSRSITRNVVIVKRIHDPPRYPDGTSQEEMDKQTREVPLEKYQTYRVVSEDEENQEIKVLLLRDLDDFGPRGAIVSIDETIARREILLPQFGVYPTKRNLEKYSSILDSSKDGYFSSKSAQSTRKYLSTTCLGVKMSGTNSWTLCPEHISASFRVAGIIVPPNAITIPTSNPISGPNMDYDEKEFYVIVAINNRENVKVRCVLKHKTRQSPDGLMPYGFQFKFNEPIFEQDRKLLLSLPRLPFTEQAKEAASLEDHYKRYLKWFQDRQKLVYLGTEE